MIRQLTVAILFLTLVYSCQPAKEKIHEENAHSNIILDSIVAKMIFELPQHCLSIEYPNKLGQVLGSDADLKSPKTLRPIFYGCFDWHSSVHGYWSIIKLMKQFPDLDKDGSVRQFLNEQITVEKAATELAFFNDPHNSSFERTYGWAWLFKLQEELHTWDDEDAHKWKNALQPLVDLLVMRYEEYLPKLLYPIRTGQHDNSAFSLSLSIDYARTVHNNHFVELIIEHGKRMFLEDRHCNLSYEPSGYDFLSPCLEEARLMSKILSPTDFKVWLKDFLPEMFLPEFQMPLAEVSDRSDGKLVHLDGLNFSRATCLKEIAAILPELKHLYSLADQSVSYSLKNISNDDYMGSHWLGTFALSALSE